MRKLGLRSILVCVGLATSFSAMAADDYGAIAYSESDGYWGFSYDYATESRAMSAAMGHCRSAGGRACDVVMRVANGCGAIARTSSTYDWVAATGLTRSAAERAALNKCGSFFSSSCSIEVWTCTSR